VPEKPTGTTIRLFLQDAIARGLRYNLGLVESEHGSSDVCAERLRALSALLPQLSATATQAFEESATGKSGSSFRLFQESPALPPTSGGFGYQDARVGLSQQLVDREPLKRVNTMNRHPHSA
jgi:hypothetical protein